MKKKTNNPQFDEVFYFEVGVSVAQMQLKRTPQGLWQKDPQSLTSESSGVLSPHVKTPPALQLEFLGTALPSLGRKAVCCFQHDPVLS